MIIPRSYGGFLPLPLGPSGNPKGKDVSSRPSPDGRINVFVLATVRDYDIGFFPAAFWLALWDLLTGTPDSLLAKSWPAFLCAAVCTKIRLFFTSPNTYTRPRYASHDLEVHLLNMHTL